MGRTGVDERASRSIARGERRGAVRAPRAGGTWDLEARRSETVEETWERRHPSPTARTDGLPPSTPGAGRSDTPRPSGATSGHAGPRRPQTSHDPDPNPYPGLFRTFLSHPREEETNNLRDPDSRTKPLYPFNTPNFRYTYTFR